jgi:hypothetical protein
MLQAQIDIVDEAGHTEESVSGERMSGGAVIHSTSSSLVSRAQASAARGAVKVTQQLQRLRDQGKIDEHGNILVPWPDDMKPGSSTDL